MQNAFEQNLAVKYGALSAKLKEAAGSVVPTPIDVATSGLRPISKDATLSSATYLHIPTAAAYDRHDRLRMAAH